jgi:hypothetical protein
MFLVIAIGAFAKGGSVRVICHVWPMEHSMDVDIPIIELFVLIEQLSGAMKIPVLVVILVVPHVVSHGPCCLS